jgi:hypothetical protein
MLPAHLARDASVAQVSAESRSASAMNHPTFMKSAGVDPSQFAAAAPRSLKKESSLIKFAGCWPRECRIAMAMAAAVGERKT